MTISKFQPSTEMFHQQVFTGPCLITSLSLHSPKFFVLNVLNGLGRVSFLLGLSEGNVRGINSTLFFFVVAAFVRKTQFHYGACVKCMRMPRMNSRAHGKAMAAFVD